MRLPVTTVIDQSLCIGCGSCVAVCPKQTLALVGGKARVVGDESLQCDHCAAVCPQGAIRVGGLAPDALALTRIGPGRAEAVAPADLVQLMRRRRSCRNFTDEPVERDLLDDLIRIGASAPSGTNCQLWSFSVLPDRAALMKLAEGVADFFRLVDRLAAQAAARLLSRLWRSDPLGTYWREYHRSVSEALEDFERRGRDRLFHGAPAAILVGMRPGASCPREDALLAAGQICLAAEALGLGTCLVGFAVEAIRRDPRIKRRLGLPADEAIWAVVAVGHPALRYARPAGRRPVPIRTL